MKEIQDPSVDIFRSYLPDIAACTEPGTKPGESVICVGKIKHVGSTYTNHFDYLKTLVPEEMHKNLKLTLAAPSRYHMRHRPGRAYPKDVYKYHDEYLAKIAKSYQEEWRILYEQGCRNMHFDDPSMAFVSFPRSLSLLARSPDFRRFLPSINARGLGKKPPITDTLPTTSSTRTSNCTTPACRKAHPKCTSAVAISSAAAISRRDPPSASPSSSSRR